MPALQIGFVAFPDVTQLDLTGPWEVLSRVPGSVCHLVASTVAPVTSNSGLLLQPTVDFAACPPLDILCVPGGPGHLRAMLDEELLSFLRRQAATCRYVTSVCTGALVLAAAGLLEGYDATTHWNAMHRLAAFGAKPAARRVVIDRNRITGGGVTAGIDFGLTLMALLTDEISARSVQLQIEYAPAPPFQDGDPATADPKLLETVRARLAGYAARMAEADAIALSRLKSRT